jgi:hypothetical protein
MDQPCIAVGQFAELLDGASCHGAVSSLPA